MKSVLVTGVSTGIGRGIAHFLTMRGYRVFGSVRREADGVALVAELGPSFVPVCFDVTNEAAIAHGVEIVRQALGGEPLVGLVNNAGASLVGPFALQTAEEFRKQVEVNLFGPVNVCRACLPLLGVDTTKASSRSVGKIINVSSIGAHLSTPFMSGYNAAKAGLEAFSHSLRKELAPYGVDVVVVVPGAFRSAIWGKTDDGLARFEGSIYGPALRAFREASANEEKNGLPGERMGLVVADIIEGKRKGVLIPVMPNVLRDWTIAANLPLRLIDRLVGQRLGLSQLRKAA